MTETLEEAEKASVEWFITHKSQLLIEHNNSMTTIHIALQSGINYVTRQVRLHDVGFEMSIITFSIRSLQMDIDLAIDRLNEQMAQSNRNP